jgi:hypothetical protein
MMVHLNRHQGFPFNQSPAAASTSSVTIARAQSGAPHDRYRRVAFRIYEQIMPIPA